MVSRYEDRIPAVILPDPADRHVVAAGIAAGASTIVTWNVRHFPMKELEKFGLRRETPDPFLAGLYQQVPDLIIGSLANARRNLTKTNMSASDFIDILARLKLLLIAKRVEIIRAKFRSPACMSSPALPCGGTRSSPASIAYRQL